MKPLKKWFEINKKAITERYSSNQNKLNKIGGFLLFLIIIFIAQALNIFIVIYNFTDSVTMSDFMASSSNIIRGLAAIAATLTIFYIFKKSKLAHLFAQITVGLEVLSQLLIVFVSQNYILQYAQRLNYFLQSSNQTANIITPDSAIDVYKTSAIPSLIIMTLFAIVVVLYFKNSQRVSNILK
ncbi:MAG: hypothetical protein LBT99_02235 [Bifidobacteriaceae bacterium]|jgi:hypothetical protein|nr:hypothetical protein [Bifidobacteriaceae bacterium]